MNLWITSDTHFGHQNMCHFLDYENRRVRPFETFQECDELMIENWNKVVKPEDEVYFLGDLSLHARKDYVESIMERLNGKRKILFKGNHDKWSLSWYSKWFADIRAIDHRDNILFGHFPIHPTSKSRFKRQVYGHTHTLEILNESGNIDLWYKNACMDYNNYQLLNFEDIKAETNKLIEKGKIVIKED